MSTACEILLSHQMVAGHAQKPWPADESLSRCCRTNSSSSRCSSGGGRHSSSDVNTDDSTNKQTLEQLSAGGAVADPWDEAAG